MQLLEDRVILKPYPKEDLTKGGIIIPETAKGRPMKGKVLHIGTGQTIRDGSNAGQFIPMVVSVGDEVLFEEDAGMDITVEGEKYLMLLETSIILIY